MLAPSPSRFGPLAQRIAGDGTPASTLARALLVFFVLLLYGLFESNGPDNESGFQQTLWTLTYFGGIAGLIIERQKAMPLLRNSLPLLAVIAMIVASSFWSDYHDISFKRALELVGTSASAYFVVAHFKLLEFVESWGIAAGIAAVLSLFFIFAVPSRGLMSIEYVGAWEGMFAHKNSLGQAMALGVATLIVLLFAAGRASKPQRLVKTGIALCLVLLVGSQSVTSYILFALIGGVLVWFHLTQSASGRRALPFIGGFIALVIAFIVFDPEAALGLLGRDASLSGRTDIWGPVMDAIGQRPLLGYGYDTFWLPDGTGSAYLTTLLDWTPYHAHNGLLELSLDIGLLGTAVFLTTLGIGLWRAVKFASGQADIARVWPLLVMVYFILGNITEANIAKYNGMNWVLFIVAYLYVSAPRKSGA